MKSGKQRLGLWFDGLWSGSLYLGFVFLLIKMVIGVIQGDIKDLEIYPAILLLLVLLLSTIKGVTGNIRKLYLSYHDNEREEEESGAIYTISKYNFMEMYRKLSNRRILVVGLAPLIMNLSLMLALPIASKGKISYGLVFGSWQVFFTFMPIKFFILIMTLFALFSIKIFACKLANIEKLQYIYENASQAEIREIDQISEKQYAYVFTKDFLLNYDGFLNIIPLKEIKTINYVSYFWGMVSGTRLKIWGDKKYTLWAFGPAESEWIKRGFLKAGQGKEKNVKMVVHGPM